MQVQKYSIWWQWGRSGVAIHRGAQTPTHTFPSRPWARAALLVAGEEENKDAIIIQGGGRALVTLMRVTLMRVMLIRRGSAGAGSSRE